jgi:hypothetical protein
MTKIPNLFNTNQYVLSQGKHTSPWGSLDLRQGIDFAYTGELICPFDNCVVEVYEGSYAITYSDGSNMSYFTLNLPDGSKIVCVHGQPLRTGTFNKGYVFATNSLWHHWHLMILTAGTHGCILDYLERLPMSTSVSAGYDSANHPDGDWRNYQDLYLNIQSQNNQNILENNNETIMYEKLKSQLRNIYSDPNLQNIQINDGNNFGYYRGILDSGNPDDVARSLEVFIRDLKNLPPKIVQVTDPLVESKIQTLQALIISTEEKSDTILKENIRLSTELANSQDFSDPSKFVSIEKYNEAKKEAQMNLNASLTDYKDNVITKNLENALTPVFGNNTQKFLPKIMDWVRFFVIKIVDRLTSSRLWITVSGSSAGVWFIEKFGITNETITIAILISVMTLIYSTYEYLIRYNKEK